jgi:allophanate hydrolase
LTETAAAIVQSHRAGAATPAETVARSFARIRAHGDAAIFISLRDEADAIAEARALAAEDAANKPLYGVPVAVKDNIDGAGMPTTAGCPAFSYQPANDATCVARLKRAGAIVIGKTNLDQFATGLNGTRSPYGIPRNAFKPGLIPGGSSSGSAVAVAAGLVPVALGTDTAGSGRVPAMLNNIVGLKPSLGLVSNHGVVPACRTLDCVSVFALTTDDAWNVLDVIGGFDPNDPYSRAMPTNAPAAFNGGMRIGVPKPDARVFFGDEHAATHYEAALKRLEKLGAIIVEIDIEPFYETARLLYEGPWVAERLAATRELLASSPDSLHPVTREILVNAGRITAADAFAAFYRLEELRRAAGAVLRSIDAMVLPTAPTVYTVDEMLADPIRLNSRLGTYTNFVNLLDLCGLAVPASIREDGAPFGVSFFAPGGADARLAALGRVFHAGTGLPLGALGLPQPQLAPLPKRAADGEIAIAVVGAHLSGMPLNRELTSLGARLIGQTATAPDYRLYALTGSNPPKPGLLRVEAGKGTAIEIEIWALPAEGFGRFVANVPPPLAIGTLSLKDGRTVKGFLVESAAVEGARDISGFGGWRAYLAQTRVG